LWRIAATAWWARRAGFQLAHIFFNDSAMVFPPLLKLLGIKVIVSRRDLGFWHTPGNLRVLRIAAKFVDCVIANCEAVRQVVIGCEGYPPERVQVIYNGSGRPVGPFAAGRRQDYGVPEGVPLVVLVANLRPLKRVGDAVRALAGVPGPGLAAPHLLVVGEDREGVTGASHRAELERIARALGVSNRLHFAGKMADPMPVIALADVCLLCSETEGLSNVVIEYMLAAKPVVCTAVGGNSELILEGQTGGLVPVGDVARLAEALAEVLGDPGRARQWGDRARQRALELFAPTVMIERHQQLYEALAGSAPAPSQSNSLKE
jgi:glycosyltransferase involved in cell wall biosynthesis